MIVDCAHYRDGARQETGPLSIAEAGARARSGDGFVWLGLHEPSEAEMEEARREFDLHELAVEDAQQPHQRPKLEEYADSWFAVLRTAEYDDKAEMVEFGELHLFLGPAYAIAVRHGEPSELRRARARLEARPDLIEHGPAAAVWAILDQVVDDYQPVVAGIDDDIGEVEEQVFAQTGDPTERIYFLKREVIAFHNAVQPLLAPLDLLERGAITEIDELLRRYFRDIADHARRVDQQVQSQRELLTSVLEANLALISVRQNEVVRTISAWAAVIAVPTFIASVYGMNFEHMPELGWAAGYPAVLAVMAVTVIGLRAYFRRIDWL